MIVGVSLGSFFFFYLYICTATHIHITPLSSVVVVFLPACRLGERLGMYLVVGRTCFYLSSRVIIRPLYMTERSNASGGERELCGGFCAG